MSILFLSLMGYLVGSISSAVIVCRVMGLPDPRQSGSQNPGATNVLRLGGKKAAIITLIGDMLKGFLPVLIAHVFGAGWLTLACVGFAAFIGHLYPLFFGFKGGKGVATAFGVFLGLSIKVALMLVVTWLIIAYAFRYSSLAALIATGLAPIFTFFIMPSIALVVMAAAMAGLLFWRHQGNISRLFAGDESKISFTKK